MRPAIPSTRMSPSPVTALPRQIAPSWRPPANSHGPKDSMPSGWKPGGRSMRVGRAANLSFAATAGATASERPITRAMSMGRRRGVDVMTGPRSWCPGVFNRRRTGVTSASHGRSETKGSAPAGVPLAARSTTFSVSLCGPPGPRCARWRARRFDSAPTGALGTGRRFPGDGSIDVHPMPRVVAVMQPATEGRLAATLQGHINGAARHRRHAKDSRRRSADAVTPRAVASLASRGLRPGRWWTSRR